MPPPHKPGIWIAGCVTIVTSPDDQHAVVGGAPGLLGEDGEGAGWTRWATRSESV